MQKDDRKQINIRVDEKVLAAIERLRRRASPIPTVSELIRTIVLKEDDDAKRSARR